MLKTFSMLEKFLNYKLPCQNNITRTYNRHFPMMFDIY